MDTNNDFELKAKELDEQATESLKRLVKSMIVAKGYTMEKLAEELNKKYYTKESKANLSNKLKRGSLRFIDFERILDILDYSFEIKHKNTVIEGVQNKSIIL